MLCFSWWQHAANLASYEQQDAHEFFISMLDGIHEKVEKGRRKPDTEGNVFWLWHPFIILFTLSEVLATVMIFFVRKEGVSCIKATYSSILWDIQFKRNIKMKLKRARNVDI